MKSTLKFISISAALAATLLTPTITKANEWHCEFKKINGKEYWFEYGTIQGAYCDPKNIIDEIYGVERGREIYDPATDGWYWLGACYDGAKAVSKEAWLPYVYQDEKPGSTEGKWVLYDSNGKMVKGWCYNAFKDSWHYYDLTTGAMAKGWKMLAGGTYGYRFDPVTGAMVDNLGGKIGYTRGWEMIRVCMSDYEIYYTLDILKDVAWPEDKK